jgi:hypothetical protein
VQILFSTICQIPSASCPLLSILHVVLPHSEHTITAYLDVVASQLIILPVSDMNGTIFRDANASSMQVLVLIYLSKS